MDDLTTIKGVGPVLAKQLEEAGITSFEQLRAVDPKSPPFVLTGRVGWEYLVGEVANFVAEKSNTAEGSDAAAGGGEPHGAAAAVDQGTNPDRTGQADGQEIPSENGGKSTGGGAEPPPAGATITVTGPRRGRWRAGRHFGPTPETIPLADLSDDQIDAIENDPALTSTISE